MRTCIRHAWIGLAIVWTAASYGFGAPLQLPGSSGEQLATASPCSYTNVNLNTTINGALTTSDCALGSGSGFADEYLFFAAAGTNITATVHAPALGKVLLLLLDFRNGTVLVHDNEVVTATVQFKAPTDAFYLCRVRGVDVLHPTGAYTLQLTGVKNANGCSSDPDPATLCVNSDRFKIQVAWNAVHLGTQGDGTAIALTADTGSFWFFSNTNLELVIKVLDGRPINGYFWVFYGALTNVQYTITITDTETGAVKTYSSPQDTQASVSDTAAF